MPDPLNDMLMMTIGSTYKQRTFMNNKYDILITAYPIILGNEDTIYFSYIPVYIPQFIIEQLGVDIKIGLYGFEDIVINLPILAKTTKGIDINLSMEGITEITEEEFYKID